MSQAGALGGPSRLSDIREAVRIRPPGLAWALAAYALAPVSTTICLLLGLGFYREFKAIPFMPFVPAIAVCAGFGGLGPGLLALALSAAGTMYLFALEDYADSAGAQLAFFMAAAAVITVLSTLLRRSYGQVMVAREHVRLAREAEEHARRMLADATSGYERERRARITAEEALAAALAKCADCPVPTSASAEGLTSRELEVLRLIAEGLTNAVAAQRLVISPYTVNMHLRSVYAKLGVSSRSAAVRYALDHDLV